MIPSPPLPWYEIARFQRSRLTRVALVAVSIVPLLYGALYVWANADPIGRLDHIQAAVVNHDQVIEVTGPDGQTQPVAVGRLLAANLVESDAPNNYDWVLTDAADAEAGLADGSYKAVLTIPENLSTAATSTAGDPSEAVQGRLDLRTNDAVNFVNGQIADRILAAASAALNAQVTETYLDHLYLGFSDIKASLSQAADGAGQLAGGAQALADGATQLATGTAQLADGARRLDTGSGQLSNGLDQLRSGTSTLTTDTRQLADGAQQVADGTAQINALVQQVTTTITGNTGQAEQSLATLETTLRDLAQQCRDAGTADCTPLDAAADQAASARAGLGDITIQAGQASQQAQALADGAGQVADGNRTLADRVPALVAGIGQAADGAAALHTGAAQLSSGTAQAADGARRLADGAGQLTGGTVSLADALRDGSDQVPGYTGDERERLSEVAATPVKESAERLNAVGTYGDGLAPYFMALALWVGAMSVYLLLRPLSPRAVASTTGCVRAALAGFFPGTAVALLQVALLTAVLLWVVGVDAAQPWLMLGLGTLTALVFVAINQTLIAWFGGAGRFLAIAFVCLQLASSGGTYPIETSPGLFTVLHHLLPMTYAVHGLRAATAGGTAGVGQDVFALACFGLLALVLTMVAAKRHQRVTITRLHPTLVV
ncbi:MAG: YhgE/Pip domain-containing protein [Aeromicrobium sp.]|uniref:YhgE/Pip family protein n=1 Tax=Aeromicrobium sp. TaxID=1871063 RepID=UPI0039E6EBB2